MQNDGKPSINQKSNYDKHAYPSVPSASSYAHKNIVKFTNFSELYNSDNPEFPVKTKYDVPAVYVYDSAGINLPGTLTKRTAVNGTEVFPDAGTAPYRTYYESASDGATP